MSALVGGMCSRRDHLVPDRELRRLIRRYIQFEDLADAAIPLHLVAFDLIEGRELLLSEGPAVEAIAASAAIPGVFPPVAIGEQRLIDGGVVNNTPISHAVELGAERVYILPTQEPHSRFEGLIARGQLADLRVSLGELTLDGASGLQHQPVGQIDASGRGGDEDERPHEPGAERAHVGYSMVRPRPLSSRKLVSA